MPPKGWKSITVPVDVYNYFYERWLREKSELKVKGIRSFSGFVSYVLTQMIEEAERQARKQ